MCSESGLVHLHRNLHGNPPNDQLYMEFIIPCLKEFILKVVINTQQINIQTRLHGNNLKMHIYNTNPQANSLMIRRSSTICIHAYNICVDVDS